MSQNYMGPDNDVSIFAKPPPKPVLPPPPPPPPRQAEKPPARRGRPPLEERKSLKVTPIGNVQNAPQGGVVSPVLLKFGSRTTLQQVIGKVKEEGQDKTTKPVVKVELKEEKVNKNVTIKYVTANKSEQVANKKEFVKNEPTVKKEETPRIKREPQPVKKVVMRSSQRGPGEEIRWATIIPLIGGSAMGCRESAGSLPQFHLSYSPFASNDKHIAEYWPGVPYYKIDKNQAPSPAQLQDLDYVNSVCPCAGLSMLNTSKGEGKRGSGAAANKWMLDSSTHILARVRPKVLWGENAPGLFTSIGEGVVHRLREIGEQFGYSFSVMKTSTEMHGIPQRRIRTFYFFWNSPTVPKMEYQTRPRKKLLEYLKDIPKDATQQDMYMAEGKASERFRPYQWVLEREGLTHKQFGEKLGKGTITTYLEENNLIPECINWLKEKYPTEGFWNMRDGNRTHVDYLEHVLRKRADGLGYWDDSPRFMDGDSFAAVMKKTMMWAVHPEEDRFLNAREFMHLMGLPHDFEIDDVKNLNHIAQNVPTVTARDMADQVKKYVRGELEMTEFSFLKQDNMTKSQVYAERGRVEPVTLEQIMEMEKDGEIKITASIPVKKDVVRFENREIKPELTAEEIEKRKEERRLKMEESKRIREEFIKKKAEEREERIQKRKEEREERLLKRQEEADMDKERRIRMMEEREERLLKIKEEREAKLLRRREEAFLDKEERLRRKNERIEAKQERIRQRKEENVERRKSSEVDMAALAEEQKKFMCYICKIFPRPGSFNRSELYRHYAHSHFRENIKEDHEELYSRLPSQCTLCDQMVDKGKFINHIGQVHLRVEDYLPKQYHVEGAAAKRRSPAADSNSSLTQVKERKDDKNLSGLTKGTKPLPIRGFSSLREEARKKAKEESRKKADKKTDIVIEVDNEESGPRRRSNRLSITKPIKYEESDSESDIEVVEEKKESKRERKSSKTKEDDCEIISDSGDEVEVLNTKSKIKSKKRVSFHLSDEENEVEIEESPRTRSGRISKGRSRASYSDWKRKSAGKEKKTKQLPASESEDEEDETPKRRSGRFSKAKNTERPSENKKGKVEKGKKPLSDSDDDEVITPRRKSGGKKTKKILSDSDDDDYIKPKRKSEEKKAKKPLSESDDEELEKPRRSSRRGSSTDEEGYKTQNLGRKKPREEKKMIDNLEYEPVEITKCTEEDSLNESFTRSGRRLKRVSEEGQDRDGRTRNRKRMRKKDMEEHEDVEDIKKDEGMEEVDVQKDEEMKDVDVQKDEEMKDVDIQKDDKIEEIDLQKDEDIVEEDEKMILNNEEEERMILNNEEEEKIISNNEEKEKVISNNEDDNENQSREDLEDGVELDQKMDIQTKDDAQGMNDEDHLEDTSVKNSDHIPEQGVLIDQKTIGA